MVNKKKEPSPLKDSFASVRILWVNDDPSELESLREMLRARVARLDEATSQEQTRQFLYKATSPYHLAITDLTHGIKALKGGIYSANDIIQLSPQTVVIAYTKGAISTDGLDDRVLQYSSEADIRDWIRREYGPLARE